MGPFPGNWLDAHIADLTPDLLVLLSWGSTVVSFHSRQSFSVSFFNVSLGLPTPACLQSVYHMLFWLHLLERSTCPNHRSPLSIKWGRGPQAEALPVARLTLMWPHPLAWYCRSVWSWPYQALQAHLGQWSSFTGMEHGAPHTRAVYMATGLLREVSKCGNWK